MQKRLIIAAPRFKNGVPDYVEFENLHARLCEQGPVLTADISADSRPFCDFEQMYPGYTLLIYVKDIAKISAFDASVLDEWIFSHESSVIIFTHKPGFLPKRWQDTITVEIDRRSFFEEWQRTKPRYHEHIRIWMKIGLKVQDSLDNSLAELVFRSSQ